MAVVCILLKSLGILYFRFISNEFSRFYACLPEQGMNGSVYDVISGGLQLLCDGIQKRSGGELKGNR